MAVAAGRYATARTAEVLVNAGANQKVRVRAIHLSVPAGEYASISLGGEVIAATEDHIDMAYLEGDAQSAKAHDLTLDSSGAVSYTVLYDLLNR